MIKSFLSLLALGTLFATTPNIVDSPKNAIENADTSKIGQVANENGPFSFEEENGWTFSEENSCSYSDEVYYDGSKSLHVARSSSDTIFEATTKSMLPMEGGKRYRLGFYYCSKNSYATAISMVVSTFDSNGNKIRDIQGGQMKLNADPILSDWNEFFIELQAKNEAVGAKITIQIRYGNADVYFDKAFIRATGDDVFEETFSTPKQDGTFYNWDLDKAICSEDNSLLIESKGSATTVWNKFLSKYGYTFTFDVKGKENGIGKVAFKFVDSNNETSQEETKEFEITGENATRSIEITVKHAVKCYITFSGNVPFYLDNIHAVKSYSPNEESGWQGKWVTYPDKDITMDATYQNRWYRKKFTLSEKIVSASMQMTADDVRHPFLNGETLAVGRNWSVPTIIDITSYLKVGENVLATRVYNGSSYSGLLFEITAITESGRTISIFSDNEVLTSKTVSLSDIGTNDIANEDISWTQLDYDDSSWVNVYVVGSVGSQPWGSIPFVSLASTTPKVEVVDASFPSSIKLGDTMTFSITWKPLEQIEHPLDLNVSFWSMFSTGTDEEKESVVSSSLTQIDGPEITNWVVNQSNTVTYQVDIPDYMNPDSYMLQIDEDQLEIANNSNFSNNKLRGYYIDFLPTEVHMEKSSIIREKGMTKLHIGEEDYIPFLFMQSDSLTYTKPSYVKKMYESGIKIMAVGNCKVVDNVSGNSSWTDEDEYDFSNFDDAIYSMLTGAPKSKILAMVSIDPPTWWLNKYPEEKVLTYKGGTDSVSYASKRWLKDVGKYVRAVLEHMKNAPYAAHIFGVKFAQGATYEWQEYGMELGNCADFSKVAQTGFREFLTERYKTDSALQKAWGDSYVTLKTANIPSYGERESSTYLSLLDGIKQRSVLDYQDFKAHNVTNSILYFANIVKEVSDGNWLAGTYQGYITNALTYESSGIGNNEFSRLLEKNSNVDFFCGPISYQTRQTGYSNSYMQAVTSITNASKLCLAEFDERTVKVDMPDQSPATMDEWGKTYTLEDTIELMNRDAANAMITGAAAWIYDMTGGWYDDEELYKSISLIIKEWEYANSHIDNSNNREVAFIIEDKMPSDYAYNFGGSYSALEVNLSRQKEDLAVIGAGYDTYLASEFKKGLEKDYKVYIFVGNRYDSQTRDAINKTCKKDGTALLWIGTPGIYGDDGSMSAENISSLIDMNVTLSGEYLYTAVSIDSEGDDPLLKDAKGITYGKPEIKEVDPVAYVNDSSATTLGKIKQTDLSGLAYKEVSCEGGSYTTMFSSIGHVPAQIIRNLMKKVSAHVYDESYSDVVFSSNGYLCIDSPYGGDRTISLPKAYDVYDVYNSKLVGENITSFSVTFDQKTTYLYRLMPANSYNKGDDPVPSKPDENDNKGNNNALIIGVSVGVGAAILVGITTFSIIIVTKRKKQK